MTTFAQLFEERRGALDNGAYARSKAPEVFRGTNLVLSEGMPAAPSDGALLGIAFYSLSDLVILDDLVERSRQSSHSNLQVRVFDILVFHSMQDVETVFPGLAPAYCTPMMGVWATGQMVQKGSGIREAQRIARTLFA